MKNLSYLVFLLCFGFITAQQSIIFQPEVQPESVYETNIKMQNSYSLNFKGDDKFMEALEKDGTELPIIFNQTMTTTDVMETGHGGKEFFPFTIDYKELFVKVKANDIEHEENLASYAVAFGHYEGDTATIDSVQNNKMPPEMDENFIANVEFSLNSKKYPKEEMKIGNSFFQNEDFDFPLGGIGNIKFEQKTEYILKEVKEGFAFFDLNIEFEGKDSNLSGIEMEFSGGGSGKMEYDLKNKYIVLEIFDFELDFSGEIGEIEIVSNATGVWEIYKTLKKAD